jgi:hypothetical protein
MKLYFREQQRAARKVEISVVLDGCHPLMDHVWISRVRFKNGIPEFEFVHTANFAGFRQIYTAVHTKDEADSIKSTLQKTYFDYLDSRRCFEGLSETTVLKSAKAAAKEKKATTQEEVSNA